MIKKEEKLANSQNNAHPKQDTPKPSSNEATLLEDLQRTRADFENYRKNVEKDKEVLKKLSKFATIEKILPLLDDLDRAFSTYPKELTPLRKNFEKTLKTLSLERIETEAGTEFDPDVHEAVMFEDGDGEKEIISETLRPGYKYEGEILRPAMVKVKRG